ncbi:hypothetical protein SCHPADRAFT_852723 [Schizopora paradoxa]|uniref:Mus7/MMS22 family-domain-containing protein n=1 Tax=Schizopora paradoxa TaxID=27342 RepID=A0A0H2RMS2_9AGAM|nr:hypothetical protein SCHPADRAFT_852723 [Schizopora paradoxa]
MESEEYVETSDPEEMEAALFMAHSSSRQASMVPDIAHGSSPHRKRRKLTHDDNSSRHSTPFPEVMAFQEAPTLEDDNHLDLDIYPRDTVISSETQSDDELDVISQRPRAVVPEQYNPLSSDIHDVAVDEPSIDEGVAMPFLFTPPQTPDPVESLPDPQPSPQPSSHSPSPHSSPASKQRFSSLPPSSPSRSQQEVRNSQRARSHSPIPSPSRVQPLPGRSTSTDPSPAEQTPDPIDDHELAANLARSRYSFRSRKPQQQRPYAYDLQLYKGQLQNIPEAIVAAPKHHDRGEGHHRNGHSHEKETQDDDFIVPDDGSDRETQNPRPDRPIVHERAPEREDVMLPESMQMSDDDDLPELPWSLNGTRKQNGEDQSKSEKHRRKRFPLRKHLSPSSMHQEQRNLHSSSELERQHKQTSQPKQQDDEHLPYQRGPRTRPTEDIDLIVREKSNSQASSSTVNAEIPIVADAEDFGPLYSDDLPQPYSPSPPTRHRPDVVEVSSDEETKRPSSSEPEVRRVFESMDSKKQRKHMKAWSRMMPAVMITKLLGQPSVKPTRKGTVTPPDRSDSELSGDLAPGQSKRLRKGNAQGAPIEIRGDTESSDSSEPPDTNHSESSDATESYISGEDERAQDEAVEAGWFDHDSSRRYAAPSSRRNEDLIDRMLIRTRTVKSGTRVSKGSGSRSGTKRPKKPSLDIVIAAPTRQRTGKQTRLPFRPESPSRRVSSSTHTEYHDLTLSDPPSPMESDLVPPRNVSKKMSKSERKRQVLLKQTYIVPSDGKVIRTGRKRRFRIDVNDDALREALAPLHGVDTKPLSGNLNNHLKPHTHIKGHRHAVQRNCDPPLRQTVLTEFENDDNLVEDFNYPEANAYAKAQLAQTERHAWRRSSKLTADLHIRQLPVGLAFGPNTYIGKQLLHDLVTFISDDVPPTQPATFVKLGVSFNPEMDTAQFTENLRKVADVLHERLSVLPGPLQGTADFKDYEMLMHTSSRHFVWYLTQVAVEERKSVYEAMGDCAQRITYSAQSRLDMPSSGDDQSSFEPLSMLWFAIELSTRTLVIASRTNHEIDVKHWKDRILLMMRVLMNYSFEDILGSISAAQGVLDDSSDNTMVAGIWVCLIHMLSKISGALKSGQDHTSYPSSLLLEVLQEHRDLTPSGIEFSEYIWRTVFSLCALSQFSANGNSGSKVALSPCWNIVVAALGTVRLTHDPSVDGTRVQYILRERDRYVHIIVSRCYLLCARWTWSLAEAHIVIDKLVSVFKSRKFSDLLGEQPDFPAFLRRFNLSLLKEIRRSDSAFCIVLKVIAMAVVEDGGANDGAQRVSNKLRRLLSLIMPIGKVPFTKQSPPVNQELSMLYNRFSSIIIAIYLERSAAALKGRVEQARRYVDFPNLDWKSKQACIRAAMHIAILVQHLKLPLDEPLKWLENMTNVLLTEYHESTAQPRPSGEASAPSRVEDPGRTVLCLQLLLGSVRLIIETPSMDPGSLEPPVYPDVGLLSGSWIKQIFATKALTSIVTTGLEIQKLVQAFLNARAKVIQPPRMPAVVNEESQESQDYFADYDDEFDYDDPDLQAILDSGSNVDSCAKSNRQDDAAVAQIMDSDITQAIYRLVIQHFQDPSNSRITENTVDEFYRNTDRWVDCWVGCAAVVVQNERRVWSYYLEMGSQSWTSISDSALRRRVGLRFMHRLLQLDPPAYRSHQDAFLKVLMESLVTFKVTLEGEYAMLLFSIDGLRHCILRDLPVERSETTGQFCFPNGPFSEARAEIIAAILSNLNDNLSGIPEDRVQSHYDIQTWIGFVFHLFSTTRDVYESLTSDDARCLYSNFCRRTFNHLLAYPRLRSQPRFTNILTWATTHFGLSAA